MTGLSVAEFRHAAEARALAILAQCRIPVYPDDVVFDWHTVDYQKPESLLVLRLPHAAYVKALDWLPTITKHVARDGLAMRLDEVEVVEVVEAAEAAEISKAPSLLDGHQAAPWVVDALQSLLEPDAYEARSAVGAKILQIAENHGLDAISLAWENLGTSGEPHWSPIVLFPSVEVVNAALRLRPEFDHAAGVRVGFYHAFEFVPEPLQGAAQRYRSRLPARISRISPPATVIDTNARVLIRVSKRGERGDEIDWSDPRARACVDAWYAPDPGAAPKGHGRVYVLYSHKIGAAIGEATAIAIGGALD